MIILYTSNNTFYPFQVPLKFYFNMLRDQAKPFYEICNRFLFWEIRFEEIWRRLS